MKRKKEFAEHDELLKLLKRCLRTLDGKNIMGERINRRLCEDLEGAIAYREGK